MKCSPEPSRHVRIATFNLNRGANVEALARVFRTHPELGAADVLFLQEIETTAKLNGPKELARRLEFEFLYAPSRRDGDTTHGIAILSRYPLSGPAVVSLTRFNLSYRSRNRIALRADVDFGHARVRLCNLHLDTRISLAARVAQMEPVVAQALAAPHSVVGGDVNTIRAVGVLLPLLPLPIPGLGQAGGLDAFMRGQGFEAPFANIGGTGPLGMRLDALFTRGLQVIAGGKASLGALSDHSSLWIDLRIPRAAAPK